MVRKNMYQLVTFLTVSRGTRFEFQPGTHCNRAGLVFMGFLCFFSKCWNGSQTVALNPSKFFINYYQILNFIYCE
jgi:hypothetical protein